MGAHDSSVKIVSNCFGGHTSSTQVWTQVNAKKSELMETGNVSLIYGFLLIHASKPSNHIQAPAEGARPSSLGRRV